MVSGIIVPAINRREVIRPVVWELSRALGESAFAKLNATTGDSFRSAFYSRSCHCGNCGTHFAGVRGRVREEEERGDSSRNNVSYMG